MVFGKSRYRCRFIDLIKLLNLFWQASSGADSGLVSGKYNVLAHCPDNIRPGEEVYINYR